MILYMYTIYDRITEDGCPPFGVRNDGTAMRMFTQMLSEMLYKDNNTDIKDYELWGIGTFDSSTLKIKAFDAPLKINISEAYSKMEELQKSLVINPIINKELNHGKSSQNME